MSVTPTARSAKRFAVHADAPLAQDFYSAGAQETVTFSEPIVTHLGESVASENVANPVLPLSGGEEIQYLGGDQSAWVRHYAYVDYPRVRRLGETPGAGEIGITEERALFFEPGGRHGDLAPLATRAVGFKLRQSGDTEDSDASAVVIGAAGLATQPALSAVALDSDGDPVAFRFDRPHKVGFARDGRPFVVAQAHGVTFLSNDGVSQTVTITAARGKVVSWRGAELLIVSAPGRVPRETVALTITQDYGRAPGLAAHDFTGWPVTEGVHAKLTARANFESLHLYLDAGSGLAQARFRKAGTATWHPALDLVFDDPASPGRDPAAVAVTYLGVEGTMAGVALAEGGTFAAVAGAHRISILHLAAGTSYDVEVAHGGLVYRQTVATRSYKPTKASAALGTVDGLVTITRSGETVTVARTGQPDITIDTTGVDYAEIHSGVVRGGTIHLDAARIILRDVDVRCPPMHCIRLGPNAEDVRIVRGRYSGWGKQDSASGWAKQFSGVVSMNENKQFDGALDENSATTFPNPRPMANHRIALIGLLVGSPRYPANTWEHWHPQNKKAANRGGHPWGCNLVAMRGGSHRGLNAVLDCSIATHRLRCLEDGMSQDRPTPERTAGIGPDFLMAHCYWRGFADDGFELEGPSINIACVAQWLEAEQIVSEAVSPRAGIAVSPPYWGPVTITRAVSVKSQPDHYYEIGYSSPPFGNPQYRFLKNDRSSATLNRNGLVLVSHATVRGVNRAGEEKPETVSFGLGDTYRHVRNTILRQRNKFSEPTDPTGLWRSNDAGRHRDMTPPPYVGMTQILADPAATAPAERLANINDGGPWGSAAPQCGAAG